MPVESKILPAFTKTKNETLDKKIEAFYQSFSAVENDLDSKIIDVCLETVGVTEDSFRQLSAKGKWDLYQETLKQIEASFTTDSPKEDVYFITYLTHATLANKKMTEKIQSVIHFHHNSNIIGDSLPNELLKPIFNELELRDIYHLSQTCHFFYKPANDFLSPYALKHFFQSPVNSIIQLNKERLVFKASDGNILVTDNDLKKICSFSLKTLCKTEEKFFNSLAKLNKSEFITGFGNQLWILRLAKDKLECIKKLQIEQGGDITNIHSFKENKVIIGYLPKNVFLKKVFLYDSLNDKSDFITNGTNVFSACLYNIQNECITQILPDKIKYYDLLNGNSIKTLENSGILSISSTNVENQAAFYFKKNEFKCLICIKEVKSREQIQIVIDLITLQGNNIHSLSLLESDRKLTHSVLKGDQLYLALETVFNQENAQKGVKTSSRIYLVNFDEVSQTFNLEKQSIKINESITTLTVLDNGDLLYGLASGKVAKMHLTPAAKEVPASKNTPMSSK